MVLQEPVFSCPNLKITLDNSKDCDISYSLNGSPKQKSNTFTISKKVKLANVKAFDKNGVLIAQKEVENECYELPKVDGSSSCDKEKLKTQYEQLIRNVFKKPDDSNLSTKLEKAFVSSSKKLVVSKNGTESIQDLITFLMNEYIFAGSVFTPTIVIEIDEKKCKIKNANISW